eukprot:jgi/Botrbrau1/15063/Bobra.118_2s0011.1
MGAGAGRELSSGSGEEQEEEQGEEDSGRAPDGEARMEAALWHMIHMFNVPGQLMQGFIAEVLLFLLLSPPTPRGP